MASLHGNLISPLFSQLKHVLSHLITSKHDDHDHHENSASMPTVPVYIIAESVEKKLACMEYRNLVEMIKRGKAGHEDEDYSTTCIVCLSQIEQTHEVRLPSNCCHVFHRECLDAWVDQGHLTCPLCRSKLWPITRNHLHHDLDHQEDPWRSERMIYLFGDDSLFGLH